MEKHILSKSTFIRGQQCLKSLYLHKKRPFLRDRLSKEQLAKFKRGTNIGILARDLFPGGINLEPKSPSQYRKTVLATAEEIQQNEYIIYEAGFQADQVLILLDILQKKDQKIYAYEVKSSLGISETYINDAALQYYVITNAGYELEDFSIIYINKDCDLNEKPDLNQLFITKSVLIDVISMQDHIKEQIRLAKVATQLTKSPDISVGDHCNIPYPCDFQGHCWKNIEKKKSESRKQIAIEENPIYKKISDHFKSLIKL